MKTILEQMLEESIQDKAITEEGFHDDVKDMVDNVESSKKAKERIAIVKNDPRIDALTDIVPGPEPHRKKKDSDNKNEYVELTEATKRRIGNEEVRDGYLGDLPEDLRVTVMNVHKFIVDAARSEFKKSKYDYLNKQKWAQQWLDQFLTEPSDKNKVGSVRLYKRGKRYRCMIQITEHIENNRNTEDEEFFHGFIRNVHVGVRSKVRRKFDLTLTCESEHGEHFEGFDVWTKQKTAKAIWEAWEDKKTKVLKEADGTSYMILGLNELPRGLQDTVMETSEMLNESLAYMFDEKSHGTLRYDFRRVFDYNTGHALKVVYDLGNIKINGVGDSYISSSDNKRQKAHVDYLQKNIHRVGNADHLSSNQKVLAIVDRVTGKRLEEAEVIGPWIQGVSNAPSVTMLDQTFIDEDIVKKWHADPKMKNKVQKIKVGEVDTTPRFKSTHWFNDDVTTKYIGGRGGFPKIAYDADGTESRAQTAERLRDLSIGSAKTNDIVGQGYDPIPGHDPVYNHPSKKDIKKHPEKYKDGKPIRESYDDIGYTVLRRDMNGLVEGHIILTPEIEELDEFSDSIFESVWEDTHEYFDNENPSKSLNLNIGESTYFDMGMDPNYAGLLWDYTESTEVEEFDEKYNAVSGDENIAKNRENFKKQYNFRQTTQNMHRGIITVRGNQYAVDMDYENPLAQTPDGKKIERSTSAYIPHKNPNGTNEAQAAAGADIISRKKDKDEKVDPGYFNGKYPPFIMFDKGFFRLQPEEQTPVLMHEIGHIRLILKDRPKAINDARKQNEKDLMNKHLLGIAGIHGYGPLEVDADVYAANLCGMDALKKSLKALTEIYRSDIKEKYIRGAISGDNDVKKRSDESIELANKMLNNADASYDYFINICNAHNEMCKKGYYNLSDQEKKLFEDNRKVLNTFVKAMGYNMEMTGAIDLTPFTRESFKKQMNISLKNQEAIRDRNNSIVKRMWTAAKAILHFVSEWFSQNLDIFQRTRQVKRLQKQGLYQGYESTDYTVFDPFEEYEEYNGDMSYKDAVRTLRTLSQSIINDTKSKKDYKVTQYTADIYANVISKNLLPTWSKGYKRLKIKLDSYQSFSTLEFKIPQMTQDFVSRFVDGRESINGLLHREPEIQIKMSPRIFHTMKSPDDAVNFFKAAVKYYEFGIEKYSDKIFQAIHGMPKEMRRLVSTTKLSGLVTMPIQMLLVFNDVDMSDRKTFNINNSDLNAISDFICDIYTRYTSPEKEKAKILDDLSKLIQELKESCELDQNIIDCSKLYEAVEDLYNGKYDEAMNEELTKFMDEAEDKDWVNKQKDPQIRMFQEKHRVKKLKKFPSDLVAYITIETDDIKTNNDRYMLASYTIGKIDLCEWYIELIDTNNPNYIVPHSRPYLVNLHTQLLQCYKKIMAVKVPTPEERQKNSTNYQGQARIPEEWQG